MIRLSQVVEASLVYKVNSRTARATHRDHVSNKQTNNKKRKAEQAMARQL
jgi:hypothetical protein